LSKLESRNPVGPRRIPTELPCSSYEEGSLQVGRPFGHQSLTTLPTRLCLATILRMGALQVESPKCGVSSHFHRRGVFIGLWGAPPTWISRFGTKWWPNGQATWLASRVEWPPPIFFITWAFYSSCRHMSLKPWAKLI
jgi:hypothetical protein